MKILLQERKNLPMVEKDSSFIMLAVPAFNISLTPLLLPPPTLGLTGGYKAMGINGKLVPDYSPIDIAICGITALFNREQYPISSLNDWFMANPHQRAEWWVSCTIAELITISTNKVTMEINTFKIAELKELCQYNTDLKIFLKRNAPFTMR